MTGIWVKISGLLLALSVIAGCSTNPVTGRSELVLLSESQEIALGEKNYLANQQASGGPFLLDEPLTRYVSDLGAKLAAVSDRPTLPYEFVVLNSGVPNAWAMPGGKIAINRGLLVLLESEAELAAVIGHEIVHAAARHTAQAQTRQTALSAGVVGLELLTGQRLGQLQQTVVKYGGQLLLSRYGRDQELEADLYGMRYMAKAGFDPEGAVQLQQKFVQLSAQRGQQNTLEALFASHPPSQQRVDINQQTAFSLPEGLTLGAESYQALIAPLKAMQPAYDQYQQAQQAFADKDYVQAESLVDEAIARLSKEGLFYALRGDIYAAQEQPTKALLAYDQALSRNDQYFLLHLGRGLLHLELAQTTEARRDLEASLALLPTAQAHYALGELALKRGDGVAARRHYRAASQGQGPQANLAQQGLARLDLPQHPGRFLRARVVFDPQVRQYFIELQNPSPVAVQQIQAQVLRSDGALLFSALLDEPVSAGSVRRYRLPPSFRPPQNAGVSVKLLRADVVQ